MQNRKKMTRTFELLKRNLKLLVQVKKVESLLYV
ncbi:conserved hypothetical protein [Bacillus cereus Q1]|uniref:Uncharacterized protein n=2 Tax=Bacillus cereus TaxID=1396 RepID=Q73BT8_BACC1|nr:hypothetical protein BCE_1330 [Bacillus cereus ATCC 10987]ACM11705.1 conserved hypothetical protein [Bacillus cereus Q1]